LGLKAAPQVLPALLYVGQNKQNNLHRNIKRILEKKIPVWTVLFVLWAFFGKSNWDTDGIGASSLSVANRVPGCEWRSRTPRSGCCQGGSLALRPLPLLGAPPAVAASAARG
jgi:hypothetical protein